MIAGNFEPQFLRWNVDATETVERVCIVMFLSEALVTLKADYLIGPTTEKPWVDIQPFLLGRGYRLRPRYDPSWIPSWFVIRIGNEYPRPVVYEDSLITVVLSFLSNVIVSHEFLGILLDRCRTCLWWQEGCAQASQNQHRRDQNCYISLVGGKSKGPKESRCPNLGRDHDSWDWRWGTSCHAHASGV